MKALQKQLRDMSYKWLSEYLGVTLQTIYSWMRNDNIPKRHRRRVVERLEKVNDDNLTLSDKILNK